MIDFIRWYVSGGYSVSDSFKQKIEKNEIKTSFDTSPTSSNMHSPIALSHRFKSFSFDFLDKSPIPIINYILKPLILIPCAITSIIELLFISHIKLFCMNISHKAPTKPPAGPMTTQTKVPMTTQEQMPLSTDGKIPSELTYEGINLKQQQCQAISVKGPSELTSEDIDYMVSTIYNLSSARFNKSTDENQKALNQHACSTACSIRHFYLFPSIATMLNHYIAKENLEIPALSTEIEIFKPDDTTNYPTNRELENIRTVRAMYYLIKYGQYTIDGTVIRFDLRDSLRKSDSADSRAKLNYQQIAATFERVKDKKITPQPAEHNIFLIQKDVAAATEQIIDTDQHVCMLNLANNDIQGGGYFEGSSAQEEMIFNQMLAFAFLVLQNYPLDDNNYYKATTAKFQYEDIPLDKMSLIHSRDIPIANVGNEWRTSTQLKTCSMLTLPFFSRSSRQTTDTAGLKSDTFYDQITAEIKKGNTIKTLLADTRFKFYVENSLAKLEATLQMAVIKGEKILGLGAAGCGAFRNPPTFIAAAFKYLLVDKGYKKYFTKIYFVILIRNRFGDSPDLNAEIFKNTFSDIMQDA